MKTNVLSSMLMVIAVGLATSSVRADTATESFDYPSGSPLIGQNGGSGWGGAWTTVTSTTTNSVISAGSLTYAGIESSGNKMASVDAGTGDSRALRALATGYSSGTVYFSVLAQNLNDSPRYLGLSLYQDTTEMALLGKGSGYSNWTINHVITNGAPGELVSDVDSSDVALLVLKVEFNASSVDSTYEKVTFWVNPDLSQPESVENAVGGEALSTDRDFGTINRVRVGGGSYVPTPMVYIDEVRVSTVSPFSPVYYESGGRVAGEAEIYSGRTFYYARDVYNGWFVVPDEDSGSGSFTNARGGSFIQCLPDNGTWTGPMVPPEITYKMRIYTPGTYRLYLRWECDMEHSGTSDTVYADIVELKDGLGVYGSPTNQIMDWVLFAGSDDGDFATNPWRNSCKLEVTSVTGSSYDSEWYIPEPGIYTLRLSMREDGAAVDSFIFQLDSLPAPTDDSPVMSSLEPPERFTAAVYGDTYLRRGDDANNPSNGVLTDLWVKNDISSNPSSTDRNIYLRFDISGLQALPEGILLTNASLNIHLLVDGVNTNHDIFVAVIDEDAAAEHFDENALLTTNDAWSEDNEEAVNWNSIYGGAPVGSFEISDDNEDTVIRFSSPGLLQAIRDDTDGVISMILYREYDGEAIGKFSSKENAAGNPPPFIDISYWVPRAGTLLLFK